MSVPSNIFGRLTHPDPATNRIIQDLYDKIAAAQGKSTSLDQALNTTTALAAAAAASAASAASSGSASTGTTGLVPIVDPLPNPTPPQSPLDVEGQLVFLSPNASLGSLYRYSASLVAWGQVLGPTIIDTHANRSNYAASDYPQVLYFESDRFVFYQSNGTNWVYTVGADSNTLANRPVDLGTNDSGFLFIAIDQLSIERWTGSGWQYLPGVLIPSFRSVSGSTTVTANDGTVESLNSGAVTFTLPAIASVPGQIFILVNASGSTGTVTVTPASGTIGGQASASLAPAQSLVIQAPLTGTNWDIIAAVTPAATTFSPNLRVVTGSSATVATTDFTVESFNSGAATFTLPNATTCKNQVFAIKNSAVSTNTLLVQTVASETIDGNSSYSFAAGEGFIIQSDGSNWIVLSLTRLILNGLASIARDSGVVTNLSTTFQDIPGLSITLGRAGTWLIQGVVGFNVNTTGAGCVFRAEANGSPLSPTSPFVYTAPSANPELISIQEWLYAGANGDVIKLQAGASAASSTNSTANPGLNSLSVTWIHS